MKRLEAQRTQIRVGYEGGIRDIKFLLNHPKQKNIQFLIFGEKRGGVCKQYYILCWEWEENVRGRVCPLKFKIYIKSDMGKWKTAKSKSFKKRLHLH